MSHKRENLLHQTSETANEKKKSVSILKRCWVLALGQGQNSKNKFNSYSSYCEFVGSVVL